MSGFFDSLLPRIAAKPARPQPSGRVAASLGPGTRTAQAEIHLAHGPVTARVGANGARLIGNGAEAPPVESTYPHSNGQESPLLLDSAEDVPPAGSSQTRHQGRQISPTHQRSNPLRDAPEDTDVTVDLSTTEILSLSGDLTASPEQRRLLCLLSDGRLLVAAGSDRYSPHVLSYIALLQRRNILHVPVQTRPSRIEALYEQASSTANPNSKAALNTKAKSTSLKIIADASRLKASDIHLETLHDHASLMMRVDGELEKVGEYGKDFGLRLIRTFYQVLADIGGETFKENERLDARIGRGPNLPSGLDGVRIATTPTAAGNKIVMRLLYSMDGDSYDLGELGMEARDVRTFEALQELPIGLNIISGPTGSGKSTTLQRTLRGFIDKTGGTKHVITVEDPPEYPIPGAVQTPVGNASSQAERAEMFINAISSAMRLDPDVIMIGEIRDLPSAELALRAATTGHQVWTTLHANGALNIVDRLVNMGLDKDMLLDHTVLTGLASQRLIRKLCPKCKTPLRDRLSEYPASRIEHLQKTFGAAFKDLFVTGPGCECCRGGTAGRSVVVETIRPDAQLCELLSQGKRVDARRRWLTSMGGQSFMQHAINKISAGITDPFAAWSMLGPLMTDTMDSALGN